MAGSWLALAAMQNRASACHGAGPKRTQEQPIKWLRFKHHGNAVFGALDGERVHLHTGDLFGAPSASGETVALTDVEWLAPCTPGKVIGL
jgi:hypothetical protein